MKHVFYLRLAFINTFKKRLRALLAITCIASTVAVMILLFGVEIGLHTLVDREVSNSDAKDVVTVNQRSQRIKINDEMISKIQSISGVSQVEQSVGVAGSVIYHGINLDAPLYAVSKNYFDVNATKNVVGDVNNQPSGSNVVVSSKLLKVFGIDKSAAIGKKVQLSPVLTKDMAAGQKDDSLKLKAEEYTITAVIDKGELSVVYMPIEALKSKGLTSVTQLKLRLTLVGKVASVRESIEQIGLQTTSIQDTIKQIEKIFSVIQSILIIFGIVVFAITVAGTFTIITLTLMEETRQIGFLRINGLNNRYVKMLFTIQSVLLTCLGAVIGVVLGVVSGFVLNGVALSVAGTESFSGDILVFIIPLPQIIIMVMLACIIGWLVGIIPSKRAVLINPLEELRL